MTDKRSEPNVDANWKFVAIMVVFSVYYIFDVRDGRFETIAYGLLCTAILSVLALVIFISALCHGRRFFTVRQVPCFSELTSRPLRLLLILSIYAALQAAAGFLIATVLALVFLIGLFGSRRWFYNLATALVMALITHFIFVILLSIPLPTGALFT